MNFDVQLNTLSNNFSKGLSGLSKICNDLYFNITVSRKIKVGTGVLEMNPDLELNFMSKVITNDYLVGLSHEKLLLDCQQFSSNWIFSVNEFDNVCTNIDLLLYCIKLVCEKLYVTKEEINIHLNNHIIKLKNEPVNISVELRYVNELGYCSYNYSFVENDGNWNKRINIKLDKDVNLMLSGDMDLKEESDRPYLFTNKLCLFNSLNKASEIMDKIIELKSKIGEKR